MTTQEIAQQLVQYCREGKNFEAIEQLYGQHCTTMEAAPDPEGNQEFQGKDTIKDRNRWWRENHEVHDARVSDPLVSDSHFAVQFWYDITSRPMGNQRMQMNEIGVYEVQGGKIVREQFFYPAMA